jgi:hypothetical protein
VAAVAELKGPDCGNATQETDKDTEVENKDFVDEDIIESNHMDYKFYYREIVKKSFFKSQICAPCRNHGPAHPISI